MPHDGVLRWEYETAANCTRPLEKLCETSQNMERKTNLRQWTIRIRSS